MVHDRDIRMLCAEKGVHPADDGTVLPPQGMREVDLSCTCLFHLFVAPSVLPNIKCSHQIFKYHHNFFQTQ